MRDYDDEERIYPQMKRKLVSVMKIPYVVNDPTMSTIHRGDVRAVAVGHDGIASVDGTQLILHLGAVGGDRLGSERDEGGVCDTDIQMTWRLPERCHPQRLAFSANGKDLALVDHSGKLLMPTLHFSGEWESVSLGKYGDSIALFSVTTNRLQSDWIVVRHDRVTLVQKGQVSDLCQHPSIVGASYHADKQALSFVDSHAKLVTYSLSAATPRYMGEVQLAENVSWSKVFFSSDGGRLAAIDSSGRLGCVYDSCSGEKVCSFHSPRPTAKREDTDLMGCAFSPDGQQLWVSNESGAIDLYHVQTGQRAAACDTEAVMYEGEQPRPASMMAVSSDGTLFFGCGNRLMKTQVDRGTGGR
jgi:WD40 repeat protein